MSARMSVRMLALMLRHKHPRHKHPRHKPPKQHPQRQHLLPRSPCLSGRLPPLAAGPAPAITTPPADHSADSPSSTTRAVPLALAHGTSAGEIRSRIVRRMESTAPPHRRCWPPPPSPPTRNSSSTATSHATRRAASTSRARRPTRASAAPPRPSSLNSPCLPTTLAP